MWRKLRGEGALGLCGGGASMLHGACSQHEMLVGAADLISIWLSTNRPVLQQCEQRATDERLKNASSRNAAAESSSEEREKELIYFFQFGEPIHFIKKENRVLVRCLLARYCCTVVQVRRTRDSFYKGVRNVPYCLYSEYHAVY